MKVITTTVVLAVMCLLVASAPAAQIYQVIDHSGPFDPEIEGWTKKLAEDPPDVRADAYPVVPDPNFPAYNAWQTVSWNEIADANQADVGGMITYKYTFEPNEHYDANDVGCTFSAVYRMVEMVDPTYGNANRLDVRVPGGRYYIFMRPGDVEERALKVFWAGGWGGKTKDIGPDGYYKVDVEYDSGANVADIYVNDVEAFSDVSPWPNNPAVNVFSLEWGVPSAGEYSAGTTRWNWVAAYVGQGRCGDGDHPKPTGDLDGDCDVDKEDLALLADKWLIDTLQE